MYIISWKGVYNEKAQNLLSTIFLLGLGILVSNPIKALVVNVDGGTWDYGVNYNVIWQQSQYSNYWHPNYHRSTAMQDNTYKYSSGTYWYNNRWWKVHNSWSYASTGYWYPYAWRSYYDWLTW